MKKPEAVRYTVTLTITAPMDFDNGETVADYTDIDARDLIASHVHNGLRKLDGDVEIDSIDVEVLDGDGEVLREGDSAPTDEGLNFEQRRGDY